MTLTVKKILQTIGIKAGLKGKHAVEGTLASQLLSLPFHLFNCCLGCNSYDADGASPFSQEQHDACMGGVSELCLTQSTRDLLSSAF